MNQPLIVTVDSSKGIAKMSGPLMLGNSYKVGYAGLTEAEAQPTVKDPETGEVTYQGPQVVLLGIPQLTEEWETANPETRIAAVTDDDDVLALTTTELVDAFKAAPPAPMPPVPPRDPRRPALPLGVALHGTARPHGAVRLHFYVTAGGATLAQGDCTINWAPFEFNGAGTPVVLQGPEGKQGEQGGPGPEGERGADGVIYTSTGCITFKVDTTEGSSTYGHLLAYADNDYELYHGGDTTKPHFILGTGTGEGKNGYTAGHLFYVYYPADPSTAPSGIDLGDVLGPQGPQGQQGVDSGSQFAQALAALMSASSSNENSWNLNTAIAKINALWTLIMQAINQTLPLLLAFLLPFLFAVPNAKAQSASARAAAIARATSAENDYLVAGWTMDVLNDQIVNVGSDGSAGNLAMMGGAELGDDTPLENMGQSLLFDTEGSIKAAYNASALSTNTYDPLGGATSFTIAAWVRRGPTISGQNPTAGRIFSDTSALSAPASGLEWRFVGNEGKMMLLLNGTAIPGTSGVSDSGIPLGYTNEWGHLAVTYDGTNVVFYRNAVRRGSYSRPGLTVGTNTVSAMVGNTTGGQSDNSRFLGSLDNVMVYKNWAATASDIRTIMYRTDEGYDIPEDVEPEHAAYDLGTPEALGDMHPTNTLYTAPQVDALVSQVESNADWLDTVGQLASNAVPNSWLDSPSVPHLNTDGHVAASTFILGDDAIARWENLPFLPAKHYEERRYEEDEYGHPQAYWADLYDVEYETRFKNGLAVGTNGSTITSWDDLTGPLETNIASLQTNVENRLPAHIYCEDVGGEGGFPYPYYEIDDDVDDYYGGTYTLFRRPIRVQGREWGDACTFPYPYSYFPWIWTEQICLDYDAITNWGDLTWHQNRPLTKTRSLSVGGWPTIVYDQEGGIVGTNYETGTLTLNGVGITNWPGLSEGGDTIFLPANNVGGYFDGIPTEYWVNNDGTYFSSNVVVGGTLYLCLEIRLGGSSITNWSDVFSHWNGWQPLVRDSEHWTPGREGFGSQSTNGGFVVNVTNDASISLNNANGRIAFTATNGMMGYWATNHVMRSMGNGGGLVMESMLPGGTAGDPFVMSLNGDSITNFSQITTNCLKLGGGTLTGNLVIAPDSGGNMPWINFLRGTWNDANTDWQIACSDGNLRFYRSKNGGSTTQFMLKDDGTITGNASAMTVNTTTVSAVETRVSDLEAQESEYWCKWPGDSLSTTEINWIPTNWPARTVYCYAYCESGTYDIAVPSNTVFAPAAPHTLHLRVFKTADATVYIRTAGGSSLGSFSGNSIIHRDVELAWRPGIGWICTQTHIDAAPQYSSNDSSAKHVRGADLPADEFLPWFATNAPANLSLSAPLQTLENPSPTSGETTENVLRGPEYEEEAEFEPWDGSEEEAETTEEMR